MTNIAGPRGPRAMPSWVDYLNQPVDGASLGIFRIVFGAMIAWDALRYLHYGWVDEYFVRSKLHFTYLYLDFVRPLPAPWIYGHFYFIAAMGILVSLGLFYRTAIVGLFVTYTYFFFIEQSIYMNHYYLIALLSFLLCWMPAHRVYSVDHWRGATDADTVPYWCVQLLRLQFFIVYFYGAIAKLNPDWLRGEPMLSEIIKGGPDIPPIAKNFPPALLAYAIAYLGIIVDTAIPIFLSLRPTRGLGYITALIFHALNAMFLRIGIFSYLMAGAITIFFEPEWPRKADARLTKFFFRSADSPAMPLVHSRQSTPTLILIAIHAYVLFQLLFPLRHLLFPGYVSWNEEGHRFAWHMKLRKKVSTITITAKDPASGREWEINPADDLRYRQMRKLGTFPDIMLQYAHYTRDRLVQEGITSPEIRVHWMCALNGRQPALLVDPTIDLGKVERTWRHATWVTPNPGRFQSTENGLLSSSTPVSKP